MRNYTIDIMKGIGILLVGLHHSTVQIIGVQESQQIAYYTTMQTFIIQIFFVTIGYLVYDKITKTGWLYIHVKRWVAPMIIFSALYWIVGNYTSHLMHFPDLKGVDIPDYILHIVRSGFSGLVLWFLWCMIMCYGVSWILEKLRLKIKFPVIIMAIILIGIINVIPTDQFGIFTVKWYSVFFLFGYLVHHYQSSKVVKLCAKYSWVSLILFPILAFLFEWMLPYQTQYIMIGLAFIIPAIQHGQGLLVPMTFVMGIIGVGCIYTIAKYMRGKYLIKIFAYLGSATVGLYLIRIMFVGITSNVFWSFVISTIISIVIYEILRRIWKFNSLLFGGK